MFQSQTTWRVISISQHATSSSTVYAQEAAQDEADDSVGIDAGLEVQLPKA